MTTENGIAQGFTIHGRPVFVTNSLATESDQSHNVNDTYRINGANGTQISGDLKTYAFAKASALRWSRTLCEPVTLDRMNNDGGGEIVFAHEMSADEFAEATFAAEIARIGNAIDEIRSVEMDARATREDAESALVSIKTLAATRGVSLLAAAELARSAAETFETFEWYVLVRRDDENMLAELSER